MAYRVIRFEPTPNPNALKCVLDRAVAPLESGGALTGSARSYRNAAEAEHDPIAKVIFAAAPKGAITSVLIRGDWLAVNKSPAAEWKTLRSAISAAMAQAE